MSSKIPGGYPEDNFSPERDSPVPILRGPDQIKEKKFLEEFLNTSEMRIWVGADAILEILKNANKARIAVFKGDLTDCEFLESSLVTTFDDGLFDDPDYIKQHFWIALGSADGLNRLIAKSPARHIIEYKKVDHFGSWTLRFGGWKSWVPVGPAVFPDIAIETSNAIAAATGNYLTEWLGTLYQYLSVQKYTFSFSPGELNTIVVDFED